METSLRLYQIARDGKIIGVYTLEELVICIDEGRVTLEDYYIVEGMPEWRQVSTLGMAIEEAREDLKDKERKAQVQARLAQNMHAEFAETWMASLTPPQGPGRESRSSPRPSGTQVSKTKSYPYPSGLKRGIIYILCSGLAGFLVTLMGYLLTMASIPYSGVGMVVAVITFVASFLVMILLVVVGAANLNAYSIEKALQRFDSYRDR